MFGIHLQGRVVPWGTVGALRECMLHEVACAHVDVDGFLRADVLAFRAGLCGLAHGCQPGLRKQLSLAWEFWNAYRVYSECTEACDGSARRG